MIWHAKLDSAGKAAVARPLRLAWFRIAPEVRRAIATLHPCRYDAAELENVGANRPMEICKPDCRNRTFTDVSASTTARRAPVAQTWRLRSNGRAVNKT
ncbi:hypothetical protein [Pseudooceanicola nanhaiensis]|uniref:hypothetical protein n=1 Tax=Pseudooceanicola nanhaiensis TaxID=375761 RepID=UPI001CD234CE|nr:hypothetical protein [Pseudooceanicola nanhaiensis]MCA0920692.1 hypothetical protein [Pseudooceanicola nanhaiensis]